MPACLPGWLAGWLAGWLPAWLPACLAACLPGYLLQGCALPQDVTHDQRLSSLPHTLHKKSLTSGDMYPNIKVRRRSLASIATCLAVTQRTKAECPRNGLLISRCSEVKGAVW